MILKVKGKKEKMSLKMSYKMNFRIGDCYWLGFSLILPISQETINSILQLRDTLLSKAESAGISI